MDESRFWKTADYSNSRGVSYSFWGLPSIPVFFLCAAGRSLPLRLYFRFGLVWREAIVGAGGNVEIAAVAISKRSWERWKACSWLSTVSTTRHFHGPTVEPIHPQTLLQNRFSFMWMSHSTRRVNILRVFGPFAPGIILQRVYSSST